MGGVFNFLNIVIRIVCNGYYLKTTINLSIPLGEDPAPPIWKGKDGSTWNKEPPNLRRAAASNVIRTEGRVENIASPLDSPMDAAKLFLTDELLQKILRHTNDEGERVAREKGAKFDRITQNELESYLGLPYKTYVSQTYQP